MDRENIYSANVEIPFSSEDIAQTVHKVISFKKEYLGHLKTQRVVLDGNKIKAHFEASQVSHLRVGINGFLDKISLVSETVDFALNAIKS